MHPRPPPITDPSRLVISNLVARAAFKTALHAGLAPGPLVAALGFDPRPAARPRWMPWASFAAFCAEVEAQAGGPDADEALLAEHFHTALPAPFRSVLGGMLSSRALYRFAFKVFTPAVLLVLRFDLGGGRSELRLRQELVPGAVGSLPFMRQSVGVIRGMTRHMDLPHAGLSIATLTDRTLEVVIALPPATGRTARPSARRAWPRVASTFATDLRAWLDERPPAPPAAATTSHDAGLAAAVARLGDDHGLTVRQREILEFVARGLANKEIAGALDLSEGAVEYHVGRLLQRIGVDSRTRLVARAWERANG